MLFFDRLLQIKRQLLHYFLPKHFISGRKPIPHKQNPALFNDHLFNDDIVTRNHFVKVYSLRQA